MDIRAREVEKMVKLLKAMGYKFVLQSPSGEMIKDGLDVVEQKAKRTIRRGFFDELEFDVLLKDMQIGDVELVRIDGTKFKVKETAAQLSGMGVKRFGKGNFTVHRASDTTIECMRTG
mgnify:FL=1